MTYSTIGDKTGPYFSLPDMHWVSTLTPVIATILSHLCTSQMPEITTDEMAKAKVGFAI